MKQLQQQRVRTGEHAWLQNVFSEQWLRQCPLVRLVSEIISRRAIQQTTEQRSAIKSHVKRCKSKTDTILTNPQDLGISVITSPSCFKVFESVKELIENQRSGRSSASFKEENLTRVPNFLKSYECKNDGTVIKSSTPSIYTILTFEKDAPSWYLEC